MAVAKYLTPNELDHDAGRDLRTTTQPQLYKALERAQIGVLASICENRVAKRSDIDRGSQVAGGRCVIQLELWIVLGGCNPRDYAQANVA